ncbi:hypothetical protein [Streptomyces agglomeratus]|uniref:hypothetical protein n=1 Tax=Streptomyces agglomeratus TaxID=285458 RepID=UPI000ABAA320|nr:hypothetical protein [Streptomyces agglomeratus]
MFQETPIYSRLVAERGDIPAQVRHAAERIHRDMAQVIAPEPSATGSRPQVGPLFCTV